MVIGIDANPANRAKKTGTEWYTYHLIEAMKELPLGGDQVFLYTKDPLSGSLAKMPEHWQEKRLAWPFSRLWTQGRLSLEMKINTPDVLFVPAHVIPVAHPQATVTTIHDVGFRDLPDLYEDRARKYLEWSTKQAVDWAKKIITVSEFTRQRLIDEFHANSEQVVTIHSAFDHQHYRVDDNFMNEEIKDKYNLQNKYLLYIGRLESKKNTANLVRAFNQLATQVKDIDLVLVGKPGHGYNEVEAEIAKSEFKDRIHQPGWVPEEDIPTLMKTATAFIFPSRYEGFGIPILEAMACQTPVLCSDIPPLREVGGAGAIYLDPDDWSTWSTKMAEIVRDTEHRNSLAQRGIEQSKKYSWIQAAKQTLAVLRGSK